ncbi:23S rRNA methyltransferase [Alkalihalobacillus alcalophilus ATCC 27647 = CGMCC 1.3604]|uniref:RNA methyltransferase n=1 Tax=Alkalihalobacillus alcalophilus ATCC 27647 = CGMCC 1.3604 TaxID=1218173 RepID=A0A094XGD2_ALKAL|nr:RNA methyltransferase [Alkalihalobacillus alcalophilus]KGA97815.1 RNA methyltransferase [Alkalihalobacillus alcalophilus ATCC 27647 = CGMCC 1.3604]MED1563909.1 RNA methyltransferase [Alkalihalobacillus alcalophilus]THG90221.1 23S rRNA methyltransferase [Alkalihalobacillus alcalophilus ATCC 27647 = CGMCC 1.3604]
MKRIESVKNEQVKNWKKLLTKKGRDKSGQFLLEGFHLIEEALKAKLKFEAILVTNEDKIESQWQIERKKFIIVTEQVLKELSEMDTPQGVVAIVQMPTWPEQIATTGQWLLIDRVQDPGNIGTMIRTAEAAGLTGIVLGEGSVDLYNGKVVRATQGALFHIPIIKGNILELIPKFKAAGIPVFGTALEKASSYTAVESQAQFALIVGNEGQGVEKSILAECDQNIYIPIFGQAESLNVAVASGILMYYLKAIRS